MTGKSDLLFVVQELKKISHDSATSVYCSFLQGKGYLDIESYAISVLSRNLDSGVSFE